LHWMMMGHDGFVFVSAITNLVMHTSRAYLLAGIRFH
jgi:hypothetical protein